MYKLILLFILCFCVQDVDPMPWWADVGVKWNTQYESLGAGIIKSEIEWENREGTYTVGVSKGLLTNVKYAEKFQHPVGPPTPAIYGTWKLTVHEGYFVFREPNKDGVIDGYFGFYENGKMGKIIGSWDTINKVKQ